jgi:uncharacterized protein
MGSNVFMTLAWYGHLKWKGVPLLGKFGLPGIIVFSWLIAFFEYLLMIPANRFGSRESGGSMDLFQLKLLQEVISIVVFTVIVVFLFKGEAINWRYTTAFCLLITAVGLIFFKT